MKNNRRGTANSYSPRVDWQAQGSSSTTCSLIRSLKTFIRLNQRRKSRTPTRTEKSSRFSDEKSINLNRTIFIFLSLSQSLRIHQRRLHNFHCDDGSNTKARERGLRSVDQMEEIDSISVGFYWLEEMSISIVESIVTVKFLGDLIYDVSHFRIWIEKNGSMTMARRKRASSYLQMACRVVVEHLDLHIPSTREIRPNPLEKGKSVLGCGIARWTSTTNLI